MNESRDHYVYRAFDESGGALYVGVTSDMARRRSAHRSSVWYPLARRYGITGPLGKAAAYRLEALEISRLNPTYNRMRPNPNPVPRGRGSVPAPHVSLGDLRAALGLTLDQVCDRAAEAGYPVTRGGLSAIEHGHRGASVVLLKALEQAYGLRAGAITTAYEPRSRIA